MSTIRFLSIFLVLCSPALAALVPLSNTASGTPDATTTLLGFTADGLRKIPLSDPTSAVDVKLYGAKGDGATDDTLAIAAAVAAASQGAVVYFPAGTYRTTAPIVVNKPLVLAGAGATIKSAAYTDGTKLTIASSNVTVRGLTFDGGYTGGLSAYTGWAVIGIRNETSVAPYTDIRIERCTVKNSSFVGIGVQDYVERLVIDDCDFTNNWCSIYFATTTSSTNKSNVDCAVRNSRFYDNWGTGGQSGACKVQGDYTRTTNESGPQRFSFTNNHVSSAGEMGIEIWKNASSCSVVGNIIDGCEFAVSLDGNSYSTVASNTLTGFTYCGVEVVQGSNHCTVTGNTINGFQADGTTRSASTHGIISSGATTSANKFIGNMISGCGSNGIELQGSTGCQIESNRIEDSGSAVVLKWGNYYVVSGNTFIGPFNYFIFCDWNDGDGDGVIIDGNTFRGSSANDGIILYDNAEGHTLSNVRISNNDTTEATYGNGVLTGINNQMANTPNLQVFGNRYKFDGATGACKFVDYTNAPEKSLPYDPVFQIGGITVAGRTSATYSTTSGAQWIHLWHTEKGVVIGMQGVIRNAPNDAAAQVSLAFRVDAAPYEQGASITVYPHGQYGYGVVEEVIYDNSTSSTQDIWIKVRTGMGSGTITAYFSEHKDGIIQTATATSTEPTFSANVVRAYIQPYQAQQFTGPRIYAQKSISSYAPSATFVGQAARLHIRGVGTEGGTSVDRIARFDLGDGTESVGIDAAGKLLVSKSVNVGSGANVSKIVMQYGTPDFGDIAAGAETTIDFGVGGAVASLHPVVWLGWGGALPDGIVVKQARVAVDDYVKVTIRNVTGSTITVGSVALTVSVLQF